MHQIPVLSFFSGGGFLDIGLEMANFNVVWSNEFDERYADIYSNGIQAWHESRGIQTVQEPNINLDSIDKLTRPLILHEAFGSTPPDIFGVVGGPPCQDFSHSGHNKGSMGNRGRFTQTYIDFICDLKPAFFLMENVPGLYKKKHRKYFDSIVKQLETSTPGYITTAKIVSALELGVPQDRDRLFLVGFRRDIISEELKSLTLLQKDFQWFEWPKARFPNAKKFNWPQTSAFGNDTLVCPPNVPLQLTVNSLVDDKVELLPNGQDTFVPYSDKFYTIDEGDVSGKSFKRLHRYRYSPTVWYGNNEVHLHPWKPRRLSVREALRIQTVPDEYIMPAHRSLTDKFRVISNGVPSEMARQIGDSIQAFVSQNILMVEAESTNDMLENILAE